MKSIESPDVKLSIRQTEEGEDDIIRNGGNTSKFFLQQQEAPLFRPEFGDHQQLWELMGQYLGRDVSSIQKSIVGHVEYTLAMTRFNFSNFGCMQAVAFSLRDRMIECFNDTNQYYLHNDVKRVYFLSMEYILGRQMQNNLLNGDLEHNYRAALKDIGYNLTDLYEEELDINLGHGVLGRIAADSLDSLVTRNVPCWGYGLRYDYGVFRQELTAEGEQVEVPDYWLERGNPWEIERPDVNYKIRMYGRVVKDPQTQRAKWVGGQCLFATAYDMPITGYNTFNTNNLRLWRSRPYDEFESDLDINQGDHNDLTDEEGYQSNYFQQVEKCQEAEYITSIFYPNDNLQRDKEIRLKQQYFYVAATLQDIFRRFEKNYQFETQLSEFEKKNSIHLHETHSAIGILEMLRILIDDYHTNWQSAWNAVHHSFSCGLYNIKESQMEKWPIDMFGKMLPRHLEILQIVNHILLEKIKKGFPHNQSEEITKRISIIDEATRQIRVTNLCLVACHKVVFSTELQFEILMKEEDSIFRDFLLFLPPKTFTIIPNGGNPRRWIYNANRKLADLISTEIGDEQEWLVDLDLLQNFARYTDDLDFLKKFLDVRASNKWRLLDWIKKKTDKEHLSKDQKIEDILFDIMVKRVDENKRQLMYLLYIVYRYNQIKQMTDRSSVVPRFHFIGGKTAIGNTKAKQIVKLFNQVASKINSDPDTNSLLRLIFIPNYNASKEHIVVPAVDFNEQISLPGEEACTTISEKFILNGALIIGSQDATNTNIISNVGPQSVILFGKNYKEIKQFKKSNSQQQLAQLVSQKLKDTVGQIIKGEIFGQCHQVIADILNGIVEGKDQYLIGVDFLDYIKAQEEADKSFSVKKELCRRIVTTLSNLGNLQVDKSIKDYCEHVWTTSSVEVPKPTLNPKQRVRSVANLLNYHGVSKSQDFETPDKGKLSERDVEEYVSVYSEERDTAGGQ